MRNSSERSITSCYPSARSLSPPHRQSPADGSKSYFRLWSVQQNLDQPIRINKSKSFLKLRGKIPARTLGSTRHYIDAGRHSSPHRETHDSASLADKYLLNSIWSHSTGLCTDTHNCGSESLGSDFRLDQPLKAPEHSAFISSRPSFTGSLHLSDNLRAGMPQASGLVYRVRSSTAVTLVRPRHSIN